MGDNDDDDDDDDSYYPRLQACPMANSIRCVFAQCWFYPFLPLRLYHLFLCYTDNEQHYSDEEDQIGSQNSEVLDCIIVPTK